MRKSISLKVGIIAAIVTIIVIAILSTIIIETAKSALKDQINSTLEHTSIEVGRTAESQIAQVRVSTALIAYKLNLLLSKSSELSATTLKYELSSMLSGTKFGIASSLYLKDTKVDDANYELNGDVLMSVAQSGASLDFLDSRASKVVLDKSPTIQKAIDTRYPSIGSPVNININGKDYYSLVMAFPLMKDGKVIGALSQRMDLDYLNSIVDDNTNDKWPNIYRLIVNPNGIVVVGNFPNSNGKVFGNLINDPDFKVIAAKTARGENFISDVYLSDRKAYALIASHSFPLTGFNTNWSTYVSVAAPTALQSITNLVWVATITAIIAIIIIVVFFYFYIDKAFIKRVRNIQATLIDTFAVINHEKAINIPKLDTRSKDELGVISNVINIAMDKTKTSLSKDSEAVSEALNVAKTIEEGNLSVRILKLPSNPQLIELRD
ncbi:cache domain-containing protein, partial [Helicobacter sp. 13S00401-1]|uniref:cache domain-containing protein n=1 Tax=Helicobacter sp. 13S00401-1 TaxID=1905758 RepID=UPI00117B4584